MNIRHIFFLFSILFAFASCTSSTKFLQKGEYDNAIYKSVKKLIKKPTKTEEIEVLKKAYTLANNKDIDAIKQLKLSGQPDIFGRIVVLYDRLNDRQDVVERLDDNILKKIGFKHTDYSNEIVESKKKAAEFFNAHAKQLLSTGNKMDARQAFDEFNKVKEFVPNYYNIENKIAEAKFKGTNNVIFFFENNSRTALPEDFENELLKISLKKLNRQWLNFDTYEDGNLFYDYSIILSLKRIQTSPELVKEVHFDEEKEIDDGFDYLLDANGNVVKDTTGNDIKIPRYKIINCHITETRLHKNAIVSGTLDFYDNRSGQLVKTLPISSEFVFDHRFAIAHGDLNALKKETRRTLAYGPVPFPSDLQMIFDTNEDLKSKAKSIISSNRKMLTY
jgi:hypothetical protein